MPRNQKTKSSRPKMSPKINQKQKTKTNQSGGIFEIKPQTQSIKKKPKQCQNPQKKQSQITINIVQADYYQYNKPIMTLKEKKYQLITSLLSIDTMENLEVIKNAIYAVANDEKSSMGKMSFQEYNDMVEKGLDNHSKGNLYTTEDLKSFFRLNS